MFGGFYPAQSYPAQGSVELFVQGSIAECRTYRVAAESRLFAVIPESRIHPPDELRIFKVTSESRIYRVPRDPRSYTTDC